MIRLDHVNIHSFDLAATRDFLCDLLGLVDGFRPPFDFPGHWLYLGDQPIIHLSGGSFLGEGGHGWVDHVAFAPFDFEAERARLDAAGYDYAVAGIPGTRIRQLFVTGPGGVKVELQCPDESF